MVEPHIVVVKPSSTYQTLQARQLSTTVWIVLEIKKYNVRRKYYAHVVQGIRYRLKKTTCAKSRTFHFI